MICEIERCFRSDRSVLLTSELRGILSICCWDSKPYHYDNKRVEVIREREQLLLRVLVEVNDCRTLRKALLQLGRELVAIWIWEVLRHIEVKQLAVCISNFIRAYVDCDFAGLLRVEYKVQVVLVGVRRVVHQTQTPLIYVDIDVERHTLPHAPILIIISLAHHTTYLQLSPV